MPELPEAETLVRGLRRLLPGSVIQRVGILHSDVLRVPGPAFRRGVSGRTVTAVDRRAKNVVLTLDAGEARLVVNLGMTGALVPLGFLGVDPPRPTHPALSFSLGDGQIVKTTCSIGFAAYPLFRAQLDESGRDQIISRADGLMYEAKKRRNAWAGMFNPSEATTSFVVEDGELEPTSLLFRAKRSGKLLTHHTDADESSVQNVASRRA